MSSTSPTFFIWDKTSVIFCGLSTLTWSVSGKGLVMFGKSISFLRFFQETSFGIILIFDTCCIFNILSDTALGFVPSFRKTDISNTFPSSFANWVIDKVVLNKAPKMVKIAAIVVMITRFIMPVRLMSLNASIVIR